MRKKLVNEKRDELKAMDPRDLIDRICAYPDQHILNCRDHVPGHRSQCHSERTDLHGRGETDLRNGLHPPSGTG